MPDEEVYAVRVKTLMEGAKARCAACGSTHHLGRIAGMGFEYGPVFCNEHCEVWLDAILRSFTDGNVSLRELIRDVGLY